MSDPALPPNFVRKVPSGDNREREVCDSCGLVLYSNPKIVVGSVVVHERKVLMCRRAIDPRKGYWTLPAGFMELHETAEAAALREAREEAQAEIVIDRLLAVYSVPRLSQVQIMYRARLRTPAFSAGPESLEVGLMEYEQIPWQDIAFPSVRWALTHHRSVEGNEAFAPFTNPSGEDGSRQE